MEIISVTFYKLEETEFFCLFACFWFLPQSGWAQYTETQDATLPFGSYLRGKNVAVRVEKQGSNCSLSHVSPGGGGVSV